jgi:hypothetical protein
MCFRHLLNSKSKIGKVELMTVAEYESKWAEFEEEYLSGKVKELNSMEHLKLEIECIYQYNMDLLKYLLTCDRRNRFIKKIPEWDLSFVQARTLASIRISGDYTYEEVETITRMYYEAGRLLSKTNSMKGEVLGTYQEYRDLLKSYVDVIIDSYRGN